MGGRAGCRPLQAGQPSRDRRPQRALARRCGRRRDGHRADRGEVPGVRVAHRAPRRPRRRGARRRVRRAAGRGHRCPDAHRRRHGQGQGRALHGEREELARRGARPGGPRARPGGPVVSTIEQPTDPGTFNAGVLTGFPAAVSGRELADLADTDPRVVLLTADLAAANELAPFADRHPDRFFNVGIAEKNMVTMAGAMAASGLRPFVSTFAPFAGLLCAEQIRMDLAFTQLPVTVLAHHAGVSLSLYGPSHLAIEDLAMMRVLPGMTVACPSDGPSTRSVLRAALAGDGPVYVRTGLGIEGPVYGEEPPTIARGRFQRLSEGTDATVISLGTGTTPALAAVAALTEAGVSVRHLDALYIKPLDTEAILAAARETGRILTVEDHNVIGGLNGAVAETVPRAGLGIRLGAVGFDDVYPPMGPTNILHERAGLTADGIAAAVRSLLA